MIIVIMMVIIAFFVVIVMMIVMNSSGDYDSDNVMIFVIMGGHYDLITVEIMTIMLMMSVILM